MLYSDAIKTIKERLNIADIVRRYVDLKQIGSRLTAPCPFHQETKPSFSVDPEKGFFYCFGCQASGDIFEFYSRINGLEFKEAFEQLAAEAGVVVDQPDGEKRASQNRREAGGRRQMLEMHKDAALRFAANLGKKEARECRDYIKSRGVSPEIQEKFSLGWAPRGWHDLDSYLRKKGYSEKLAQECGLLGKSEAGKVYDRFRGRLMFPISNLSNQIIAFGGRIIGGEDEAKYINSQDTPLYKKKEHLYGLAQARRGIASKGRLILTEGYMDVLTLHQFGYDNSAGVLGTALTAEQIRRIGGFTSRILLLFDGDRAGRKAALRSSEMILARGMACDVAILPESEDIDSLLKNYGKAAFDDIAAKARPGLEFCIDVMGDLAPKEAVEWAGNFLSSVEMPELFGKYATLLSCRLGIDEKSLRAEAADSHEARRKGGAIAECKKAPLNMRDTQIMIFAVRYPERMDDLRELGADLALATPEARELWELLERWGKEEIERHMSESQKSFWLGQRMAPAPPLDNGDYELACLKQDLDAFYKESQQAALAAALAASSDNFEADLEYLRALQETLEKNNEQS